MHDCSRHNFTWVPSRMFPSFVSVVVTIFTSGCAAYLTYYLTNRRNDRETKGKKTEESVRLLTKVMSLTDEYTWRLLDEFASQIGAHALAPELIARQCNEYSAMRTEAKEKIDELLHLSRVHLSLPRHEAGLIERSFEHWNRIGSATEREMRFGTAFADEISSPELIVMAHLSLAGDLGAVRILIARFYPKELESASVRRIDPLNPSRADSFLENMSIETDEFTAKVNDLIDSIAGDKWQYRKPIQTGSEEARHDPRLP